MSLQRIYEKGVFDDATSDERRTHVYVRSGELGLAAEDRPEVELMQALADRPAPQRLHVVGPSGAGKTSLILRVVGDLARRQLAVRHEVLILRVGDRPENLVSPDAIMKLVLDTIAVEGHRFSNVSDAILRAAADERTQTGAQIEHRGSVGAPVVTYSASLKEAYETLGFGQNSARVRHDLEDVLSQVTQSGYRPVLVLDDTEKFVGPGVNGKMEQEAIENLYHHGVRVLGELPVDLVVAMHPRFREVDRVAEVVDRLAMPKIGVPELPADADEPALRQILIRRMERDGVEGELDDAIEPQAVTDLQLLYHEREQDLRSVLRVAHEAAGHALERGLSKISPRDLREIVRRSR